jgi:phosphoesterase RecJ-like protein
VAPDFFSFPPLPEEIRRVIEDGSSFLVIGHVSPDGDCLSSQITMGALLENLGKQVALVNAGPFERSEITHLAGLFQTSITREMKERNPIVVVVDCSSIERIGSLAEEIEGLTTIIFDHHASGEFFGDYRYITPRSISTTFIIMHLYKEFDVEITPEIADHLFFGFATDSGFFRFIGSYRGDVLRYAAELVDLGVSPNEMADRISGGKNLDYIKYVGKLIDRSEVLLDGRLIIATSYIRDSRTFDTTDRPSDMLYSMLLAIKGVEVVLYLKELEPQLTEIGFRSSHVSPVDVGELAKRLGGGGHKRAAGATVNESVESIRNPLILLVKELLR